MIGDKWYYEKCLKSYILQLTSIAVFEIYYPNMEHLH